MSKFGFIGIGNMGGALATAAVKKVPGDEILVSSLHPEHAEKFAAEHGVVASDNETIARKAKFIMLGVKPQYMDAVVSQLKPLLAERRDAVLVSMAAGLTMEHIGNLVDAAYPVIRIMPNTPSSVGRGMTLYEANSFVRQEDLDEFLDLMAGAGAFDRLPEHLIDAGSVVAGCGPAFLCLVAEALADGGVACGLPRDKALTYAVETMAGTAELLRQTGLHPGQLKDAVCSPGGTTIQGVRALKNGGMESAMMEAVIAAYEKNKEFIK